MSTVITVENLGKKYTISHQQREEYSSLRDVITNSVASLGKKLIHPFRSSLAPCPLPHNPASEDFWALKDVSFEVKQGDRIGIIGRNGAGKSTLLKILSRITEPTTGSIRIKGRVASLLEVGTGFHPELTGRENIYLNGAILGMGSQEIRKKFDEIVDFAETEKFLDTPVKRYSSGMYVRLAFAVAAHLEPEILIVDEVLAVGDAQFQRKCLGKMEDVSVKDGRTVLFVSHNMSAIESLCGSALFLKSGNIHLLGPVGHVINDYMKDGKASTTINVCDRKDRSGKGMVILKTIEAMETRGTNLYAVGDDVSLRLLIENKYGYEVSVRLSASIRHGSDIGLIACDTAMVGENVKLQGNTLTAVTCRIFSPPLNYGEYMVNISVLCDDQTEDWLPAAISINFDSGKFHNHTHRGPFPVLARFEWSID